MAAAFYSDHLCIFYDTNAFASIFCKNPSQIKKQLVKY